MPSIDIHHVNIKTLDLDATVEFYTDILNMTLTPDRPDIGPGAWLDFNGTQIHVMSEHMALDKQGGYTAGSASVDHLGILASDFDAMKQRVIDRGLDWRQNDISPAGLWQLFFHDPNGILIELNFRLENEPAGARGPDQVNMYQPGTF